MQFQIETASSNQGGFFFTLLKYQNGTLTK